jgi:hypothetical protein
MQPSRVVVFCTASIITTLVFHTPTMAAEQGGSCQNTGLTVVGDGPSDVPSPCTIASRSFLVESLYYQNASRVGGSALAAYPMVRMRAGLTERLEFLIDAPSQAAESGLAGAGVYPKSEPGYGTNYAFAMTDHAVMSLRAEEQPPASRFTPSQKQPKASMDLTTGYRFSDHLMLTALYGASSGRAMYGNQHLFPTSALGLGVLTDARTQFFTDLGMKTTKWHAASQAFGDISAAHLLSQNLAFDVGLGTTFNPVAGTKAHYLAMGVNYR